jgi:uncharacterized protein (DUF1810 family)
VPRHTGIVSRRVGRCHIIYFADCAFRWNNCPTAQKYAITGIDEAKAYVDHTLLGFRLRECTRIVNAVNGRSIEDIFGYPDHMKFQSSMTLFAHISPGDKMFIAALTKYFHGELDRKTLVQLWST